MNPTSWRETPVDLVGEGSAVGKLYVCVDRDVCSARIVGCSIHSRMKSRLAVAALSHTVSSRGNVAGCVVHTEGGRNFAVGSS